MERSNKGSFTIPEIKRMLHISQVTAYAISKKPELKRTKVNDQYRIKKADFWEWYDNQSKYVVYEEDYDPDEYFTTRDIAEMLHMKVHSAGLFIERNGMRADVSTRIAYVSKKKFIDWYIRQRKYRSDDPRLPEQWYEPTYCTDDIRKILGIQSRDDIYRLYKKKYFDIVKMDGLLYVDKESFDQWLSYQTEYPVVNREEERDGINY